MVFLLRITEGLEARWTAVELGVLGVVILSGCRRRIILGVPSMLSWDREEDLPEDRSLFVLSKDRPPPEMLEESLSKLPSDMLRMSVSVSERSSGLAPFFRSFFLSSGGVRLGVLDVSGKYMLGFFWKRSLRIIPKEDRLRSDRLSWLLLASRVPGGPPPPPFKMAGILWRRLSGPPRRSCRYHCCWRPDSVLL
jgi:hypothetical protein